MTSFFSATQGIVEAANMAMAETLGGSLPHEDALGRIREIRETVASALIDAIPENFEHDWPDEYAAAEAAGRFFVGVTSDTHRPVFWGQAHPKSGSLYREFIVG